MLVTTRTTTSSSSNISMATTPTTTSMIANTFSASRPEDHRPGQLAPRGLRVHNERRAQHGIAPLRLSSDLNEYAQHYAEHLARTACILFPFVANSSERRCRWMVQRNNDYDFSREETPCPKQATSLSLYGERPKSWGGEKAHDQKGQYFIVASYSPAGNLIEHTKIHERLCDQIY
ncbi:Golgi-associated plant pathoproteinsis- protein 1 [Bulinus truncatus]|nr:Golgi-associated plant pathoproteinsis- protein 1 [Bulinus truncatus]